MSTDDYASEYFASGSEDNGSQTSYEGVQEPQHDQPPAPAPVTLEQFNSLQAELAALKANPLQSIGYQPVEQNQPKWTPEQAEISKAFLQSQGVVTREELIEERIAEAAEEAGYMGKDHLESVFNTTYFDALKSGNTQRAAELKQIASIYKTAPKAAVKAFERIKNAQQAPMQSQSFGHVPSSQPGRSQPRFANNQEFLAYGRSNPVEFKQIYDQWMADTTGTKNPFPIN